GARHRHGRRLRHLTPRTEGGRDAVRASRAHPEARSSAPERTERSRRRVPPGSRRAEPPQARQAASSATERGARL
ncbi:MAG: Mobile element protein, partial [uncultured Acetobacteraceae bacterium]